MERGHPAAATGAVRPALRPVLPGLAAGTLAAVLSGLAMLGALWCLVRWIGAPSSGWVLAAIGAWVASALLAAGGSWLSHAAEAAFAARLRRQVAGHLVRLPASTLARHGGDALRRLVADDIAALHHMVAHLPAEVASFAVVPLASVALLVALAGPMALLALLPGVLAALYYLLLMPRAAAYNGAERMRVMHDITAAVDDYARGIRVNRIYGAQSGALAAYREAARRFTGGMVAWVARVALPASLATALMQAVATFAIAYAVAWRHDAATLAAALLFSLAIVNPARRLGHGLDYVAVGRAALARIAAVLREPVLPCGTAPAIGQPLLDADGVTLALGPRPPIEGFTHRFRASAITAITGPSGVGKSTLLRTLAGLEPVHGGTVRLGAIAIGQLDEGARHAAVLLIPQGGDVLQATVRENLALGCPEADDARLLWALRQAQIEVPLEADATRLSGGERQRVGLAQAFLTPAPVILLDEPSSALDAATATRLMAALRQLAQEHGKTLVVVTHDPALAAAADEQLLLRAARAEGETP
ncbi:MULTISPECIES: ATP-binding cassette domain-containing protein [Comamonadaceae]|uniref:ATP-binding cassette domain-containing protein n=1 Tax=Acidovorax sacchari TaxID=3230736 RepID=UPI0034A2ACEB